MSPCNHTRHQDVEDDIHRTSWRLQIKLEINMHHLQATTILAGHVQYPLSDSDAILCR